VDVSGFQGFLEDEAGDVPFTVRRLLLSPKKRMIAVKQAQSAGSMPLIQLSPPMTFPTPPPLPKNRTTAPVTPPGKHDSLITFMTTDMPLQVA
jgi:hypothetical protein